MFRNLITSYKTIFQFAVLYLLTVSHFFSCISSDARLNTKENRLADVTNCENSTAGTEYGTLLSIANPEVVKILGFPGTITYIGLQPPPNMIKDSASNIRVPKEMIRVPAGNVQIGSGTGMAHERPMFWASVKSFLIDVHPVTVAEFRKFVKATKFITQAERFGDAGVIDEFTEKQWKLIKNATWEFPLGPDRAIAPDDHPVTQVSWNDANAYAKWAGKRLPCEIEWEHAARNGKNSRTLYPWGDEIQSNGKWNANIWQGKFPYKNFNEDTYAYTSPVGLFGTTPLGLTDMSGNVWQWMSNKKFNYSALFKSEIASDDISPEYAERGGSFLCEPSWCHGYRVSGRSNSSDETSLFHLGFRCVKDVEK